MIPQGALYRPQETLRIPQGTRFRPAVSMSADTSWVRSASGVMPVFDFDFENNRYYGAPVPAYLSGPLTNSGGLVITTGIDVNGTAAFVSAMTNANGYTIISDIDPTVPVGGVSSAVLAINNSAADAPIFIVGAATTSNGAARAFHTNTAGSLDSQYRMIASIRRSIGMSQKAGVGRVITQNGTQIATSSAANNHATATSVQVGRYNGGSYLNGKILRLTVFNSQISGTDLIALTTLPVSLILAPPYLRGLPQQSCSAGANSLQYEYTQPWSAWADVQFIGAPDLTGNFLAAIIHTNVSAPSGAFPGWETFILQDGKLRVRIINDITSHRIDVVGSTNLVDGQRHIVLSTYDGSGAASGVKLYVDGVAETLTIVNDNLDGNSIISGTQTLLIGNQTNKLGFYLMGFMKRIQLRSVAKDATFAATYGTPGGAVPPDTGDSNALSYDFSGSGTSVPDLSGNGLDGTLSTAGLRLT